MWDEGGQNEMTIGNFLRHQRLAIGKTQFELSMETRIQQNQLSDYERDRTMPSAERFIRIMRALGVATLDLTQFAKVMEDEVMTEASRSSEATRTARRF
jgi:transcriptional regulator with XRE-family HTH domain